MKKISLLSIITTFVCATLSVLAQSVTFEDSVIENSARAALGFSADQNLTESNLQSITTLSLVDDGQPNSLSDLSKFSNLQYLYLDHIGDLDLSSVWSLSTNLRILEISGSNPDRLADIPDMPNLQSLGLENNKLTNVDFLKDNEFPILSYLDFEENYFDLNSSQLLSDLEGLKSSITSTVLYIDAEAMLPKGFQDLTAEKSRVNASSDAKSFLLSGIYELLEIFESTGANSLQEFAVSVGVEDSVRGFLLSDLSAVESYETELNENLQSRELAEYFQYSFIPALERADAAFSKASINGVVDLEQSLTGSDVVISVDQADVYVLRSIANLAAAFASIQSGYDWDLKADEVDQLDTDDNVSAESIRKINANFAGIRSASQLAKAKQFLTNTINQYELASPLLRDQDRSDNRLFTLSVDDLEDEADFMESLLEMEEAMSGMMEMDEGEYLNLEKLFAGQVDLANLLPANDGDKFETYVVTDPTMGGLLPNWDQRRIKEEMMDASLLVDPEIVFRNPVGGQALIVRYGDEYFWSDGLDEPGTGLTLWTVGKEDGVLTQSTIFINGDKGQTRDGLQDSAGSASEEDSGGYEQAVVSVESNFTVNAFGNLELENADQTESISVVSWDENGTWIESSFSGTTSILRKIFLTKEDAEAYYLSELGKSSEEILEGWLWFDEYPWVWSSKYENWYYFKVMEIGEEELGLHHYNAKTKSWNRFYGPESYLTDYSPSDLMGWKLTLNLEGEASAQLNFNEQNQSVDFVSTSNSEEWGYELQTSNQRNEIYVQMYGPEMEFYEDLYQFNNSTEGTITRIIDRNSTDNSVITQKTGTFTVTEKPEVPYEDYILEVYDDFNGSELNSTKWITAWWSGAQPATISSGNLKLSGSGSTYDPESLNPRGADAVISAKEEAPTMHSFAEINASGIYGFEAKVMIPTDAPTSTGVGIVGFKFNPNGTKHSMGIELGHWENASNLQFEYENEDPPIGEGSEKSTYDGVLGSWYKLALIHTPTKGYLLRDDEIILDFDTTYEPNWYGLISFNDEGKAYEVFVDEIRIYRKHSSPKGWMWSDHFPWVYSNEELNWLYFGLAPDKFGQPGMIYWNSNKQDWKNYSSD